MSILTPVLPIDGSMVIMLFCLQKVIGLGVTALVESLPEPDENRNLIDEVVDLAKQTNLEVDSDDSQKLLDFHYQGLIIDKLIEMHEEEQGIKRT
ncbi:hypothetical protein TNCV_3459241 [Trichonephila clavipes]|nr:hypothetical protein TNCV_3459241 [Trichonephila clavipes]